MKTGLEKTDPSGPGQFGPGSPRAQLRRLLPHWFLLVTLLLAPLAGLLHADVPASTETPLSEAFARVAAATGGTSSGRVRLLTDNQDAWYARWDIVYHARESIDCTYFLLDNDVFGRSFLGLLLKKAQDGVKIRLMIDYRGGRDILRSREGQSYLSALVSTGNVQIKIYNPLMKAVLNILTDLRSVIASNHDKLLIVDGQYLITGGRNISAQYCASHEDNPHAYYDADILLDSEVISHKARQAFDEEYVKQSNYQVRPLRDDALTTPIGTLNVARQLMQHHIGGNPELSPGFSARLTSVAKSTYAELRAYPHLTGYAGYDPFNGEHPHPMVFLRKPSRLDPGDNQITANLASLMAGARSEIVLQNPYVVLTKGAKEMLRDAGRRGVHILLQTNSPESTNHLLTQVSFVREWQQLLKDIPNLRLFGLRGNNLLHSKVFVIDRKVAIIGSYNLDPLSEQVNAEEVVAVQSSDFATRAALRVMQDLENSVEYKVRIARDGTVVPVVGPLDHAPADVQRTLSMLRYLSFLRPFF